VNRVNPAKKPFRLLVVLHRPKTFTKPRIMENNADLSDGARQADIVSSEHAETMFSADQAETNMVKLVDGKLVNTGNTEDDVSDDMPRIRLGSDEERALTGDDKKKYENSDAALRAGTMFDPSVMPDDPIAVGD